jgi:hypothetical protein
MGLATFWAISSQANQVTLLLCPFLKGIPSLSGVNSKPEFFT